MRSNKYRFLLVFLFLLEILSLFLSYKSFINKEVKKIKEVLEVDKKQFAMYIEKEDERYSEYTSSNIFPNGYKINLTKSNCVDTKGNKIDEILSGTSTSVTVTSNKTAYCYIYFDIDYSLSELCETGNILSSCLTINNDEIDSLNDNFEGGLYRYQGTNEIVDDNYICFGTVSKEECVSNTDKYMYRIIGINNSGNLKLIKMKALGVMKWWTNYQIDITWPNSLIYQNLNGESYLTNKLYVPNGWEEKISNMDWYYGDFGFENRNNKAEDIYKIELSFINKVNSKIALMNLSDYYYAGTSNGYNCSYYFNESEKCSKSWIHLSQNDANLPNNDFENNYHPRSEFTMSRSGYLSQNYGYYISGIDYSGFIGDADLHSNLTVRPVFYINSEEIYVSGNGTINDPIIISGPPIGEYLLSNNSNLETLNDVSENGLYRYTNNTPSLVNNYICIGNMNCEFGSENMYRIIGIDSISKELKVIKQLPIGYHQWHNIYTENTKWNESDLFNYLNSDWINLQSFKNIIVMHEWGIGDVQDWTSKESVVSGENVEIVSGKIGMMSLSDYYLAYPQDKDWMPEYSDPNNWLTLLNEGYNGDIQWTMTRYKNYNNDLSAYYIGVAGNVGTPVLTEYWSVRPTFYISYDNNYIIGNGTIENPYIIS